MSTTNTHQNHGAAVMVTALWSLEKIPDVDVRLSPDSMSRVTVFRDGIHYGIKEVKSPDNKQNPYVYLLGADLEDGNLMYPANRSNSYDSFVDAVQELTDCIRKDPRQRDLS